MKYQSSPEFVDMVVERITRPLWYGYREEDLSFMLFANDVKHRNELWDAIRYGVDDSGVMYAPNKSRYHMRIMSPDGKVVVTELRFAHFDTEYPSVATRGCKLRDVFVDASPDMISRKMDDDFMMCIIPCLYPYLENCTFVNRLKRGDFAMTTVDQVHTMTQRIEKLRSALSAARTLLNQEGADILTTAQAYTTLRDASEEALGSLNAIEAYIKEQGDMDKI